MAITVRELITKIGFKVDKSSMSKAQKSIGRMKKGLKIAGGVALGIGAALLGIGVAAVKAASDMEMMTTQFEILFGSAEKATEMMSELKTFAATTPFALKDLAKGTTNLIASGIAAGDAVDTMRMLGDTAGGSAEKLQGLVLGYSKMESTGKASLEVLNIFAERGIPIFGEMQKNLGITKDQFFKMVSAGKISTKDVSKAFQTMTSEGGLFFKGMETASLTMAGLISTMKDNFSLLLAEIGSGLLPVMKEFVGVMTELAQGPLKELRAGLSAVLVPMFQSIAKILPKLIKFLVPIMVTVGEILGELLIGLMPIFDLLEPILELIQALLPIIQIIIQVIVSLIPVIVFILKIAIKIITFVVKGIAWVIKLVFKFWKLQMKLAKAFVDGFVNLFKLIIDPIKKVIDVIGMVFRNMWDGIANSINSVIETFNKFNPINKFDIKGRLGTFAGSKDIAEKGASTSNQIINAPIKADIKIKVIGDKAAKPGDIGGEVKTGVQGAFALEFRKLLIASAR